MKTGAIVANGTDAPVEDVDPIPNYYASVSRKLKDGKVFFPDQRMSRMEALKSYTINGAYAAFEEANRGSLKPGKYADITVLSKDILKMPEDEIPDGEGRPTRSSAGRSYTREVTYETGGQEIRRRLSQRKPDLLTSWPSCNETANAAG